MSRQLASVRVPRPIATPRGAEWAAAVAIGLARIGHEVWAAVLAVEQARAAREQNRIAASRAERSERRQAQLQSATYLNRGNRG